MINAYRPLYLIVVLMMVLLPIEVSLAEPLKGWHWYNEDPPKKKLKTKVPPKLLATSHGSATQELKHFQKKLREAKASAILHPSIENVQRYLVLQNFIVEKSRRFSQLWQAVLLRYPNLDFTIAHPTEDNAQTLLYSLRDARENAVIRKIATQQGLLFFYRGDQAMDQATAKIIADFTTRYHISLLPVSVDHKVVPVLKNSHWDRGEAKKLHLQYFPALLLVNPKTRAVTPVNYGYITEDKLKARLVYVAENFKGSI